jgi:hypothetical protein
MQKTDKNIRSSHKLYLENTGSKTPVDIKTYISIANEYMKFLCEKVLEGEEVTLPARLGTLRIKGSKRAMRFNAEGVPILPPNWAKTKKLRESNPEAMAQRKVVYCTNEETNGVVYKFAWSKNRVPIENKLLYALRMTRNNKRNVHKSILSGKEYLIN